MRTPLALPEIENYLAGGVRDPRQNVPQARGR